MWNGGDSSAGFELEIDLQRPVVKLRAWGFWSGPLAGEYLRTMRAVFAQMRGKAWGLFTDSRNFPPQRPEVQQVIAELMAAAPSAGMVRAANVMNSSLDRLQLQRIAAESRFKNLAFFHSEDEAFRWLSAP